jgi:two-component system OmpR family sensor kinase
VRRAALRRALGTVRVRVLLVVVALLAVSALATSLVLRQTLLTRASERVDRAMEQEVSEFRRLVRDGRDPRTGRRLGTDMAAIFDAYLGSNVPNEGETTFGFVDGRPYRSTVDAAFDREALRRVTELGTITAPRRGELRTPDVRLRYLAVPTVVGTEPRGVFVITTDLGAEVADIEAAVRVANELALLLFVAGGGLAFALVSRMLRPLREVRDTAREIGESDLARRIPVSGNDEVAELGRTFNAMLDRLERAFASQSALVSDAGHELRTPITVVRAHLEMLMHGAENREERLEIAMDELDRMGRLVDELLLLAKSERRDFLHRTPLDLDIFTEELAAKARALGDRRWTVEACAIGTVVADRQRMTQAMMNLVRNAVEHTQPGGRIALGSALQNGSARLWVSDDGPGVPPDERARIFERFTRGSYAAGDGHGLGLAIVRAVAEAHGGRVELVPRRSPGATFAITIPVEPDEPNPDR